MIKLIIGIMIMAQTSAIQPNSGANVEQVEGLYIFVQSKPSGAYDYLGSIKRGGFLEQPSDMLPKLIKQAKKKYPDCQGLIVDINFEKADCIKFR